MTLKAEHVRAYVEYLRDLGIYELYRRPEARVEVPAGLREALQARGVAGAPKEAAAAAATGRAPVAERRPAAAVQSPFERSQSRAGASAGPVAPAAAGAAGLDRPLVEAPVAQALPQYDFEVAMPKPVSFNELAPLPGVRVPPADRAKALEAIRADIGDCTRCPLAYAGRHSIVFADGNPEAELMFVGEGPGADEDTSGLPFVGKAGQLLNNMIGAMGLRREDVYIANVVKCRPPQNRVPEPVEANTCSPFLLRQIDVVQPKVIVALGATAATYLLGVRQSLASLRGQWFDCRGAKVAVTYHPAFLLRDPRQKGEAWKDLQRVMAELGLQPKPKG